MPTSASASFHFRFAIVEQFPGGRHRAVAGHRRRSARVRGKLRSRAQAYERALQGWKTLLPTEEQRAALLRLVLELHVEVITLGRPS